MRTGNGMRGDARRSEAPASARGSSNLPVPTIKIKDSQFFNGFGMSNCGAYCGDHKKHLSVRASTSGNSQCWRSLNRQLLPRVKLLDGAALRICPYVTVVLQHLPAEMAADCLNGRIGRLSLSQG